MELPLLQEEFHKLKFLLIQMLMVFLLLELKIKELVKLLILLSLMRKEDFLKKKLIDSSKRPKNTKRLMSRESNKLNLEIISSNISTRSNLWSRMIKSKTKFLMKKKHKLIPNVKNYSNGYILTKMLLKMNMMKKRKNLKLSIILLLRKFMDNKDKVSQELELMDKVSQGLELVLNKNNRNNRELILMISTEVNNFNKFSFYIFWFFGFFVKIIF